MEKKNKKILVVDDEIDFLEIMKSRLEANGYDVAIVMNGNEAVEKVKAERPDAVLLDIMMPGIDGLDVLKEIRSDDEKLPVFMITAFSNEERFRIANKYNASGFIVKTDDLQAAINSITSALNIADRYRKQG